MLVLHASDLLDALPKADVLVALLSLSFQCPERSSMQEAAHYATSGSTVFRNVTNELFRKILVPPWWRLRT